MSLGIRVGQVKAVVVSLLLLAFLWGSPARAAGWNPFHRRSATATQRPYLTPEQAALLRRAAVQEKFLTQVIVLHSPLIQTYIQHMQSDPQFGAVPIKDEYLLGRVDFESHFSENLYRKPAAPVGVLALSTSFIDKLTGIFRLKLAPNGFMDMMFVDLRTFDFAHYRFTFVRKEFLGQVRTSVFDVTPRFLGGRNGQGRFKGRVWVEDQDGNIVRYTGTFTGAGYHRVYFHFDSWRGNVQPGVWLPMAIYVEDRGFRAQTYIWGYGTRLPAMAEADNQTDPGERVEQAPDDSQDLNPLEAQRAWEGQSEQNVLDRLTKAGLLANPSNFDRVLETVTNNLVLGSNLELPGPVHCRVLLTTDLESLAVGNTIILSKGLIDVLPYEEDLAAMLSFQLAHIVLRHPIDTRYAFSDRMFFPDEYTLAEILMNHTAAQNQEAAARALEIFHKSIYADKAGNVGLFLAQLGQLQSHVPALLTPRLGDSLLAANGTPWLAGLQQQAPPLEIGNLQQIAALPLGSHLRIDPWTDEVFALHYTPVQMVSAHDKMPFQVTPIYYRLQRYAPLETRQTTVAGSATQ